MTPLSRVTLLVTLLVTLVTLVTGLQEGREQPRSTTALEGQDTVIACKVYNKVMRSNYHDSISSSRPQTLLRWANVSGGRTIA